MKELLEQLEKLGQLCFTIYDCIDITNEERYVVAQLYFKLGKIASEYESWKH